MFHIIIGLMLMYGTCAKLCEGHLLCLLFGDELNISRGTCKNVKYISPEKCSLDAWRQSLETILPSAGV